MIKKGVIVFCLSLLVFLPAFTPYHFGSGFSSYAQEENLATESAEEDYDFASMTTYELFWPLVAGKVPGDKFYNLKLWRDKLMGYLFFSKLKKSEYFKQLANKRLVEAEKLLELQRDRYFTETLRQSTEYLEKGSSLLLATPENQSQFWLKGEYAKDLQKHLVVLEKMRSKAGEEQKEFIEKTLEEVKRMINQYRLGI